MIFQIYRDIKREWRWRLKSTNGAMIADSAEGYKRRAHAVAMARRIMDRVSTARIDMISDTRDAQKLYR
jgi:uncharacterized protein YegP (UPF0339 family)